MAGTIDRFKIAYRDMLPSKDRLTICFAHVAYRLRERFLARPTAPRSGSGSPRPTCW